MRKLRLPRRRRICLAALFAVCLLGIAAARMTVNLSRTLIAMAEAKAGQMAADELNRALKYVLDTSLSYDDFMTARLDAEGRVNMLSANTMRMGALAADAVDCARESLAALGERGVELPLGAALGSGAFSGAGPRLRFAIVPVGIVTADFVSEFETAGINQTRHTIFLEAAASVRVVVPTGPAPVTVRARVPVAESILVGEVPASYIQVPQLGDSLNFAP